MTYGEYLKSLGATEEDIKLLDTAIGRKTFEAMQAADARATAAESSRTTDRATLEKWRDEQVIPLVSDMQKKVMLAEANEAKARQAIKTLQDQGLIDVAKDLGYETTPPASQPPANNGGANGFDPAKYFTKDDVVAIAAREGEAIAIAQDIAFEHRQLFPDKPLNFRDLRAKASAANKSVEQYWMDTYSVAAAREARTLADKTAYETRLRTEGATAERERLSSTYGNPDARPLVPSNSPFTKRPDQGREKQPWEVEDRSNDRVQRATKAILDMQSGQGGRAN